MCIRTHTHIYIYGDVYTFTQLVQVEGWCDKQTFYMLLSIDVCFTKLAFAYKLSRMTLIYRVVEGLCYLDRKGAPLSYKH